MKISSESAQKAVDELQKIAVQLKDIQRQYESSYENAKYWRASNVFNWESFERRAKREDENAQRCKDAFKKISDKFKAKCKDIAS